MKTIFGLLLGGVGLATVACQNPSTGATRASAPPGMDELKATVGDLNLRVGALEDQAAIVKTELDAYAVGRTQFGPFLVIAKGVTPYLDGYKVRLSIGNLSGATFHGATLKAVWAIAEDLTSDVRQKLKKQGLTPITATEREFTLTQVFRPAAYTDVEITLTPARPEDVKEVQVSLVFNEISLR